MLQKVNLTIMTLKLINFVFFFYPRHYGASYGSLGLFIVGLYNLAEMACAIRFIV